MFAFDFLNLYDCFNVGYPQEVTNAFCDRCVKVFEFDSGKRN